jgi:two-component system, cell cycle sensor histidine kinase and response regulator CckA
VPLKGDMGYDLEGINILVVDDNPAVLRVCGRMLRQDGCRVFEAESPQNALLLAAKPELDFDLLLAELSIAPLNGLELAGEMQRTRPKLFVLIMGSATRTSEVGKAFHVPNLFLLAKPFDARTLMRKVATIVGRASRHGTFPPNC